MDYSMPAEWALGIVVPIGVMQVSLHLGVLTIWMEHSSKAERV